MTEISQADIDEVRAFAESHMTYTIEVLRGSLSTMDPATGIVSGQASGSTVYSGKARVRPVRGSQVDLGGGEIATRDTVISVPIDTALLQRDDLVRITADGGADPQLDTRIFRVLTVEGGGIFGDARRFGCQGWYNSRYWKPS